MVHGTGLEVVERDDAGYERSEGSRNPRIADVGDALFAFDFEVVDFRLKGIAYPGSGAREIDDHAAGTDHIHFEPVGFEPAGNGVEVLFTRDRISRRTLVR